MRVKKTILSLCCFLALLLTGTTLFAEPAPAPAAPALDSGVQPLASAEPAPGAPALNPADQQFLASLAMPEPALMAKPAPPNPCGPDFCTSTQQQQCMQHCWSTVWCDGILSCNTTSCTSTCVCAGRCY